MPNSTFKTAYINGIVTIIPTNKKRIDDEIHLYGGDVNQIEKIKSTIGLNERYVVDKNTTTADLSEEAANYLLDELGIDRNSIDALILVTQTPDYFQPSTAAYLHGRLKMAKNCASFDVNLGCSGYVYGIWLAFMMVESASCNNVLLLAGDTMSRCVNPRDRTVAALFGDAASATLIKKSEYENESFFSLHTDGTGFNSLIIPAGGFRNPKSAETSKEIIMGDNNIRSAENLYMNGAEIFNFSIYEEPLAIQEILAYAKKKLDEIDYIIFHQANKYIITNIATKLKFPLSKAPCSTVEKYGNQSSASIPVTICDAIREEIIDSGKNLILSGFGAGLSWASCFLRLEHVLCASICFQGGSKL